MKISIKKGLGFGLTSGIITTLGLIVGLQASTDSKSIVLGGILIIAIADALSDALGVHVSEEAESQNTTKQIWESTLATFLAKLITALTFVIPVLIFSLYNAMLVSIFWGLSLIILFSYYIGRKQETKTQNVILEHVVIAISVIVVTHYIGTWVSSIFG